MTNHGHGWIGRAMLAAIVLVTAGSGLAAATPQQGHEAADPRLQGLESLYPDDALANIGGFCSQRLPDTQIAWEDLLGHWRAANRVRLDELQHLQAAIDARLRARPVAAAGLDDWLAIATARADLGTAQLRVFATLSDAQARHFCDEARTQEADTAIDDEDMSRARSATALALALLDRPR